MVEVDDDISKSQAKPCPASCLPLPLGSWLPPMVFSCSNWGHSPHTTTTGFRTGIDLEVVFLVGLQRTLLEAYARFLGLLKTCATMMRRPGCSSLEVMDGRPGCGHDIKVVITRISLNNLIFKMRFVSHMPRSCDWSYFKIM